MKKLKAIILLVVVALLAAASVFVISDYIKAENIAKGALSSVAQSYNEVAGIDKLSLYKDKVAKINQIHKGFAEASESVMEKMDNVFIFKNVLRNAVSSINKKIDDLLALRESIDKKELENILSKNKVAISEITTPHKFAVIPLDFKALDSLSSKTIKSVGEIQNSIAELPNLTECLDTSRALGYEKDAISSFVTMMEHYNSYINKGYKLDDKEKVIEGFIGFRANCSQVAYIMNSLVKRGYNVSNLDKLITDWYNYYYTTFIKGMEFDVVTKS